VKKFTLQSDDFYRSLGFKSGLEIHYQLLTERKLFCRCPARKRNDPPDAVIKRHMRPTLSELGEYDGTALMEFKTKKNVYYQLYRDTVCTYEMDDTPPFPVNPQAVDIALELALLLHCTPIDEIHITRKQYLDGSIPTGFQRTATIGVDGWIELYSGKRVGISHVCLEEDACREMGDHGHDIIFRTDRLSFPLIEVITRAELLTPAEVAEAAGRISAVLRATGKVRRGIGTVRQDVNVSIAGGTRVEIKGVPRIPMIPYWVHSEALRQAGLLKIRDELRARGITKENLRTKEKGLNAVLGRTQHPALCKALDEGLEVRGICLYGFGGLLAREIQPGVPFARDFEGRVRVIACLDTPPILLHTDSPKACGLGESDLDALRHQFNYKAADAVLLVWGPEEDTKTALREIRIRAEEATAGVPSETRQALRDGTNDFERILPGPDRMYPDTDSPPVPITPKRLEEIRARMPEDPLAAERRYLGLNLPAQWARLVALSPLKRYFDALLEAGADPRHAARLCVQELPALKLTKGLPEALKPKVDELLDLLKKGELGWDEAGAVLQRLAAEPGLAVQALLTPLEKADLDALQALRKKDGAAKAEVLVARLREERGKKLPGWRVVRTLEGGIQ
jgi:glutamyl-tRNA(Gln) amidotransferase subunit E